MNPTLALIAFLNIIPGPMQADVIRVIDGDTVEAIVYPWPGEQRKTAVRFAGIDAPEIRGKCEREKALALQAKKYVESLKGTWTLYDVQLGKFAGRIVAKVVVGGKDVGDMMVGEGLARRYEGGKRESWC